MDIYKRRKLKFFTLLIFITFALLITLLVKKMDYPFFSLKIPDKIKVGSVKGNAFSVKNKILFKLKENDVITLDRDTSLQLNKKAILLIKFSRINLQKEFKGPVYIKMADVLDKIIENQQKHYLENRKQVIMTFLNFASVTFSIIIIWAIFAYLKNYYIGLSFIYTLISGLFSIILLVMLKITFLPLNPYSFFLFNAIMIIASWLFFEGSPLIPEGLAQESKLTDLLLEGYDLYKNHYYGKALAKFKQVIEIDPQRYDVKKLMRYLEEEIKTPPRPSLFEKIRMLFKKGKSRTQDQAQNKQNQNRSGQDESLRPHNKNDSNISEISSDSDQNQ
ncbi:MAG: hypothetical protein JW827_08905 [Spirochaetes bacterium]|nr:hypothetical protein [Spirochaetota bacterium]